MEGENSSYKNLESKGYICDCECKVHQIKKLGVKEINIPDLKNEKRMGVIKILSVKKKIKDEKKPIEKLETESIVFKKYWYESIGRWKEIVVILEKSEKIINGIEEVEKNLDFIKFVNGEDEELNKYRKRVILLGVKSLFELEKISYWDKFVYFLYNVNSTGKSSGVALLLTFYSAYYKIGIPDNFSVTGKIDTDNGNIKGIGGLKEKFLCSIRSKKIDSMILPQEDYEEVLKISNAYSKRFASNSKKLNFYPVNHWKDLVDLLFRWNN